MSDVTQRPGVAVPGLERVGHDRWRVRERSGLIRGHIEARPSPAGTRYRAVRFHTPSRGFRAMGEFWSLDEALECVRLSR